MPGGTVPVIRPAVALAVVGLAACGGGSRAPGPPTVVVSIPPQIEVVERLVGDRAAVETVVPVGRSPHTYHPTPQQLVRLSTARLLITAGIGLESVLVPRLSDIGTDMIVVDGTRDLRLLPSTGGTGGGDDHASHGAGSGDADPHFWMDPVRVGRHARTAAEALGRWDPGGRQVYRDNLAALEDELSRVHARIRGLLAPFEGRPFLVFHSSFRYFAERYGLRELVVEVDGAAPSARRLTEVLTVARGSGIRTVFVQPQLAGETPRAVADELDGRVVELDPMAADLLANLERVALRLAESFEEAG